MAQQIPGRAPNILDLAQMRALARRTPTTPERDLEGENRLKIELVKAIADLEKTKSDMKKATLTGMTDMLSKFATAQASMLGALAAEAQAKAETADAKASLIKTITGEFEGLNGAIAAGQPEATFMENIASPDKGIASIQTAFTSAVSNPDNERARLIQELLPPGDGSPRTVGTGFDDLVDMLDKEFVTGSQGMVAKVNEQMRTSTPIKLAVNANGAMRQVASGIAAAVQAIPNVPDGQKALLFDALVARAATSIEKNAIVASGDVNLFTNFAANQREALDGLTTRRKEAFKQLGVQINPAEKKALMGKFDEITGLITTNDPIAQLQVARARLAQNGIKPPEEFASDDAKKAYDAQLTQEFSATTPMEGFAQRVATLPVSPEIDRQIDYLKGQLGKVGEVPPDALTAATAQLRQSMGAEQFEQWRRTVNVGTDEEAAMAAARNPGMLREFRGIVADVPTAPQAPAALRTRASMEAQATDDARRKAAREALQAAYDIGQQAAPSPRLRLGAPDVLLDAAQQKGLRPFDLLPEAESPGESAAATPPGTPGAATATAPQRTLLDTALEQRAAGAAQLFARDGLMARQARGATGPGSQGQG